MDSVDHYQTAQIARKWTSAGTVTVVPGGGRNGTQGFHFSGAGAASPAALRKTFASQGTLVIGFAFRPLNALGGTIVRFQDGGANQVFVRINVDQTLSVGYGSSFSGPTSFGLSVGNWYYLELEVVFSPTGSYDLHVDTVSALSGSVNTAPTGHSTANSVVFGNILLAAETSFRLDDVYLLSGSGGVRTTFLGDVMAQCLFVDSDGDLIEWTPTAGSNYQNVAAAFADDDLTFNWASASGKTDLYNLGALAGSPASIFAVQWNAQVRKADASAYLLNRVIKSGGTTAIGATTYVATSSYVDMREVLEQDPAAADWTGTTVDALQAGIKLTSVV